MFADVSQFVDKPIDRVLAMLDVDITLGLTRNDVNEREKIVGSNTLQEEEPKPLWVMVKAQFEDPLVRILLAAAFISLFLSIIDHDLSVTAIIEPAVIFVILIANAIVGISQESGAEKSLKALGKLQANTCTVLREGEWSCIDAAGLVPGDIIECKTGNRVPADCRVVKIFSTVLKARQSELTGESYPVTKTPGAIPDATDMQSYSNVLFCSTMVLHGRCMAVVIATGMRTEIGKIHATIMKADDATPTPLEKTLEEFGRTLSIIIAVICIIVWAVNYQNFTSRGSFFAGCIYYLKIAIALAVAAIPEGLPAVITTCLALGTRRMSARNAIVRRLSSVETLGCTTVICSDKTGTLTTNEMVATDFAVYDGGLTPYCVEVSAKHSLGRVYPEPAIRDSIAVQQFLRVASICNEGRLAVDSCGAWTAFGDPTETALKSLVEKIPTDSQELNDLYLQQVRTNRPEAFGDYWRLDAEILATLEFTRSRKSMSVMATNPTGTHLYVKGAPESIISRCAFVYERGDIIPMTAEIRESLTSYYESLASRALRTISCAIKCNVALDHIPEDPDQFGSVESELIFLGIVGIVDPPRPEVSNSISICKQAGIRVIMITGDHKATADAIAKKIGIHTVEGRNTFLASDYCALDADRKNSVLSDPEGAVISRADPTNKYDIVNRLKNMGEVVAMTGDGVNDAPALRHSDIGISLGIAGTEVAKEASDIILADDNFATIVSAIEEGRTIFDNIKCFIRYLVSSNIGEVVCIFLGTWLRLPETFLPIQLLWVNLVTDGPPATALGFNKPDRNIMLRSPRDSSSGLINKAIVFRYFLIGAYVGIATTFIFVWYFITDTGDGHTPVTWSQLTHYRDCESWTGFSANPVYGMPHIGGSPCDMFSLGKVKACTLSLTALVVMEMLNSFNSLSETSSLLQVGPLSNPYLISAVITSLAIHLAVLYIPGFNGIFGVVPLTWYDWFMVLVVSIPVVIVDEIYKFSAAVGRYSQISHKLK